MSKDTLEPELLLRAYAMGVFPMADAREADSIYWVEPRRRAILPLERFHLSRSLRKTISADRFRVSADAAFERIIALCAESAADRPDTWINRDIEAAFIKLHHLGRAHSIEIWDGERLAGGLYGLALGRAFFGESMVSRARDASKVAMAWLVARLRAGGFTLLDCQFMTEHLASLGAVEISRADYLSLLAGAVDGALGAGAGGVDGVAAPVSGDFGALDRLLAALPAETDAPPPAGKLISQLIVQTS